MHVKGGKEKTQTHEVQTVPKCQKKKKKEKVSPRGWLKACLQILATDTVELFRHILLMMLYFVICFFPPMFYDELSETEMSNMFIW